MFVLGLLRLAFANLLIRKLSSSLTMVGLLFGSAAFIATLSTTEGSKIQIQNQMRELGTDLIWVNTYGGEVSLDEEDDRLIKKYIDNIQGITFKEATTAKFRFEENDYSGGLVGADALYFSIAKLKLSKGRVFDEEEFNQLAMVAVLGSEAADKLFNKADPVGSSILIEQEKQFFSVQIIGVLAPKGGEEDKAIVLPRSSYNKLASGYASQMFLVKTTNESLTSETRKKIQILLTPKFKESFYVYDAATSVQASQKIMSNINLAGLGLAIISLITGGIGIMNVMLLSIAQRKKEIGLRKALGATSWVVMTQFLMEAVLICVSGTIVGAGIGIYAGYFMAQMMGVAPSISWFVVGVSFLFSICIGLVFGLLPALKASRLDPYEALRG